MPWLGGSRWHWAPSHCPGDECGCSTADQLSCTPWCCVEDHFDFRMKQWADWFCWVGIGAGDAGCCAPQVLSCGCCASCHVVWDGCSGKTNICTEGLCAVGPLRVQCFRSSLLPLQGQAPRSAHPCAPTSLCSCTPALSTAPLSLLGMQVLSCFSSAYSTAP